MLPAMASKVGPWLTGAVARVGTDEGLPGLPKARGRGGSGGPALVAAHPQNACGELPHGLPDNARLAL